MALDISALMASLSLWEDAGYVAIGIVGIGCIGESICDFTDWVTEDTKKWLGKASALVLIFGLAAEGIAQVNANGTTARIVAILNNEAAQANERAAALEQAASWRELSRDQHDKIVALIKESPNLHPERVLFDSVVGNPEAQRYGNLLSAALSEGLGISISKPLGLSTCLECTGVWVCVDNDVTAETIEDGKLIRGILEASGVQGAKFCTDPKNGQGGPTVVKILVGPKESAISADEATRAGTK